MAETASDWRDDPRWRLVQWDDKVLSEQPPDRPSAAAELAQPDAWATLYLDGAVAATWSRA